jgi:hypothetical protein
LGCVEVVVARRLVRRAGVDFVVLRVVLLRRVVLAPPVLLLVVAISLYSDLKVAKRMYRTHVCTPTG